MAVSSLEGLRRFPNQGHLDSPSWAIQEGQRFGVTMVVRFIKFKSTATLGFDFTKYIVADFVVSTEYSDQEFMELQLQEEALLLNGMREDQIFWDFLSYLGLIMVRLGDFTERFDQD